MNECEHTFVLPAKMQDGEINFICQDCGLIFSMMPHEVVEKSMEIIKGTDEKPFQTAIPKSDIADKFRNFQEKRKKKEDD